MRSAADTIEAKEGAAPSPGVALFLLAKPGIVAAVALSGYAGMVVGCRGVPPARAAFFCLTSVVLAAAGSALLNNVLDRRIDLLMERVQKRSTALSALGVRRVVPCALSMIAAALAIGALHLGAVAVLLLSCAILSYTLYYTLYLKRRSHWGALLGGIPGALPVLIGAGAVGAPVAAGPLILFLVMLLWQPPHFWLLSLAHQEDYRRAGLPVLPVAKGESFTRKAVLWTVLLLAFATLLLWLWGPCSPRYAASAAAIGISFWGGCAAFLSRRRYRWAFTSSIAYLMALLAAVVADLCIF